MNLNLAMWLVEEGKIKANTVDPRDKQAITIPVTTESVIVAMLHVS